jgi:diguanylate cyclase (GGDEF)-like protein
VWCFVIGALSATVFLTSSRPWVQATAQIPVYGASALLLIWRWLRSRRSRPDGLMALAVVAFGAYFCASILGVVVPLTASSTAAVPVPSLLDGLFLLSYLLLGLFLWRLGSRSVAAGRSDLLDMLIVLGGVVPVFWLMLVRPLVGADVPSAALVTYLAYPAAVFGLFAMTVRLAVVAARRSTPHLLLGAWILFELTADVVYLHVAAAGQYAYGQAWQVMWIVSATCIAALALHPQTEVLLQRQTSRPVIGSRRLYALAGCVAMPIGTVMYSELLSQGDMTVLLPAVVSLVLVVLLSLRLSGLMVDNAAQLRDQERLRMLSDDLAHQTLHDPLTGMGNRSLFAETTDRALAERVVGADQATAVLLLDLNDFKSVNDTFGHEAGDRVLVEVSRRLKRVSRQGETAFRLGGDEFAFVLREARLDDVLHLADRVNVVLDEPFDLGPRRIRPSASTGISIALQGQDRSTLLAEADMAMYQGKSRGSGAPSVFDPTLHRETLERHQLERDLREATSQGEMVLLYQPLVHLAGNQIVGVEALVRWQHPTRGTVSPMEFIPLAEANGTILDIGDWVLRESLRQLREWDLAVPSLRLRMSVNVSPRQLADPDFVGRVAEILRDSSLAAERITLEITEAAFGRDAKTMIGRLHELKALGVKLAIDDFGTDYASLSQLRRLPVDILKIDKSFVSGIATEPAEWALTTAIIRLADSLGKATIAEGIETGGQLAHLRSLHVELGQGYLFGRPVTSEAISVLLAVEGQQFLSA